MASERGSVATRLEPLITGLLGQDPPIGLRFWDDSVLGPPEAPAQLVVRSPMALRYLIYGRGELGLARAYVSGTLDVEGDIYAALGLRDALAATTASTAVGIGPKERLEIVRLALTLGILGPPPPVPPEEIRLTGGRHTKARDQAAISAHYDISNDFYALVLGETMTYSCAYFATDDMTLDDAQRQKCDHICRKLGLEPSMRLLDVGCGWGSMLLHAASHYGVTAVGITISRAQAELARARVKAAGLAGSVEIRVQDYRDVADGPFDAISSIGMFEHVGQARLKEYFSDLYGLLSPRGRLCNHAISRPGARGGARPELGRNTFIDRYVFPDGELHEVGTVVSAMQNCGFEVRDVESLREHYARTLRAWVENLESHFEDAVGLVGAGRARVWRLYMAASALNFQAGRTNVHQVLGVRQDSGGGSGMPATRAGLYAAQRVSLASSTG